MNRFRTKRRAAKDDTSIRPSQESQQSAMSGFKSFRRGKKSSEVEQKVEIDISNALPASDDFRTSLLMTGLSARFSMLREQDDPNTKIGKASDDSVLYPRRQSRMMDFAFGPGLSDIAEVESIRAPPPIGGRIESYASSDDGGYPGSLGSVMERPKPTEGNNLFGGRQKVYKIGSAGGSGKAVYDDDVAVSAFQKKRMEEKALMSFDFGLNKDSEPEPRSGSPQPTSYERKRETSSTTSSVPSVGRNSTAATSITSQPTPATKEFQSVIPSSSNLDRSVTRGRRLYEQGLSQEMHEQQSSALSRIDTLAKQRTLGTRTPDLAMATPSPTAGPGSGPVMSDRFATDRRPILSKASAPNLRSMSPPTTASSMGTMDLGLKMPAAPEPPKAAPFGGAPPLSPPSSETEDQQPAFPIQPNDRGKATALGVFQKPVQPYDESRYAQRQLQMQQGRETPTTRFRAESNASYGTARSRSNSSAQRNPFERYETVVKTEPPVEEESPVKPLRHNFLDGFSSSPPRVELPRSMFPASSLPPILPPINLERPSDLEHPALRDSAMPTPLSISTKMDEEVSPISEEDSFPQDSTAESPVDSPTLGPTPGLSGMVRQHLRNDSNASSVYGAAPQTSGLTSRFPIDTMDSKLIADLGAKSNPWDSHDHRDQAENDWNLEYYGVDSSPEKQTVEPVRETETIQQPADQFASTEAPKEEDAFANQLADGARRIRERLTLFAGTDSKPIDLAAQAPEPAKANPLGTLRPKGSRGSLIDRTRGEGAKAMKKLGLGAPTTINGVPTLNGRDSFEEVAQAALSPMQEEPTVEGKPEQQADEPVRELEMEPESEKEEENMHEGLKQFRQARRQLQRLKEVQTQTKYQSRQTERLQQRPQESPQMRSEGFPPQQRQQRDYAFEPELYEQQPEQQPQQPQHQPQQSRTTPNRERANRQRTPSRERKPPPVYYRPRAPSEESKQSGGTSSRSASRPESRNERDRSSSEASNNGNGNHHNRPPRLNPSPPSQYDDYPYSPSNNGGSRPPMMRSPGLPGTDIKRSPIMPPQPYPGSSSPNPYSHQVAAYDRHNQGPYVQNLQPHRHQYYDGSSAQPSPVSPHPPPTGPLPSSPFLGSAPVTAPGSGTSTPTLLPSPRRPSAPPIAGPAAFDHNTRINESMKKVVNKNDISEPTFISTTSRVPTVNLPITGTPPPSLTNDIPEPQSNSRARSGSRARAGSNANGNAPFAPPLPPINPKRRQQAPGGGLNQDPTARHTRAAGMLNAFMGRSNGRGLADDDSVGTLSTPHLPLPSPGVLSDAGPDESRMSTFSVSDDEDKDGGGARRRLRKATSEAYGLNARAKSQAFHRGPQNGSPPFPSDRYGPPFPGQQLGNGGQGSGPGNGSRITMHGGQHQQQMQVPPPPAQGMVAGVPGGLI